MPSLLSPGWAFAAEAIDAVGDTHLPPGLHLRCLPSPLLGLPATPLVVTRGVLDRTVVQRALRQDGILWRDAKGNVLTPPFAVGPRNPVTGHIQAGAAIYAELVADAAAGALRIEALGSTGQGDQVLASRGKPPLALAQWTIPRIRVVGTGTVSGLRWLDASVLGQLTETHWTVWSLPVLPAPRYQPTADAIAAAKARVDRGAVLRQPLHIAFTAAGPASAPAAGAADAQKRLAQMTGDVDRWLKILLTDLSRPMAELADTQPIAGLADRLGNAIKGQIGIPIEGTLISGSIDPDLGRHLGFGDVDRELKAVAGSLAVWRIRGLWRWRKEAWNDAQRPYFTTGLRADATTATKQWPELEKLGIAPREATAYVDAFAWAVALVGQPPDPPPAVAIDLVEDRGWLAKPPPPEVRRVVRLGAGGFRPRALGAFMANDSRGARSLHPYPKGGRWSPGGRAPSGLPLSLVVSRPDDATVAGRGRFEDRDAIATPVDYRLAPGDWFGRWGEWAKAIAPAKARTPPMRPVIEIFAEPAVIAPDTGDAAVAGTITLRIQVPQPADLPPGGAPLASLVLDETFGAAPVTTVAVPLGALPAKVSLVTDAVTGITQLVIARTGPLLPRGATSVVRYTGRWVDTLGAASANADPVRRTMVDPRAPLPPVVETRLRYTARPDPEGNARVELDFASVAGGRYRVFASTETTLLAALDAVADPAAAAIRAAAPGAPRAEAFRTHRAKFGWDAFESLTAQPLEASGTTTRFVHRVSGALEGLVLYRVLAEGPSGQLSEMTSAELMPFAVPNLGGPTRPLAGIVTGAAPLRLRVKVPRGRAVPVAWRLRMASVPVADALRMRVLATGPVANPTTDREGTSFDIEVPGPLPAWRQVRFAVEVQAGPPPGAPTIGPILPGEWSEASAPVAHAVIPPAPPDPPGAVTLAVVDGGLQVTLAHPAPDSLVATPLGAHVFEVWRIVPGQRPQQRVLAFVRDGGGWVATDPGGAPPAGTTVTVTIIDPIGRRSASVPSNPI